ncbi:MGMT family protein [Kocuria carniphila]|uniref:MGMT family protein n=1 Tax=Kocuria carniphila TaxID=262208 RepID=A0ABV3V2C2_9MICC
MPDSPYPLTGDAAARAVRNVVLLVPPGSVLSYGDVAELAGLSSARLAARIMARGLAGDDVAWWRIVRADGSLPDHLQIAAREHYVNEGTPLKDTDAHLVQVAMSAARWDDPPDDFAVPAG